MSDGGKTPDPVPLHIVPVLSRRDLMDATKQAVKELISEQATAFGWWSAKTLGVAGFGAFLLFVLWVNGYGRHS